MRFQTVASTGEQRAAVQRRFEELMQPEAALTVIRRYIRPDSPPAKAVCSAAREPGNRFIVRVDTEMPDGSQASYALKGYVDGRGEQIGELYKALLHDCQQRGEACPVIQPIGYVREERLLVIPWVHGISLEEALRAGRADVIEHAIVHAPRVLAQLHASRIVPETETAASEMVQLTLKLWDQHYQRFPEARELVEPLTDLLQVVLPHLPSSSPVLVHGDAGPGNFLFDGKCWRLLDLETYGYTDPAYDAGYLLAKLEYECLRLPTPEACTRGLVAMTHRACLDAMPELSTRHMAFFYGMTLVRKPLKWLIRVPSAERSARWPDDVAHITGRAAAALNAVSGGEWAPA